MRSLLPIILSLTLLTLPAACAQPAGVKHACALGHSNGFTEPHGDCHTAPVSHPYSHSSTG